MIRPENGTGWFPQMNTLGEIASSGLGEVWARDAYVGVGGGPVWIETNRLVFGVGYRSALCDLSAPDKLIDIEGYNSRHGGSNGRWAGARPGLIHLYNGATKVKEYDGGSPLLSQGGRFGYVTDYYDNSHRLLVDGVEIVSGHIMQWAMTDTHIGWIMATGVYTRAAFVDGKPIHFDDTEGAIWLFDDWVMTQYSGGYKIRPIGATAGYILRTGNAYNPSIQFVGSQIKFVASTSKGELFFTLINPSAPRESLLVSPTPTPIPPPLPPPVKPPPVKPPPPLEGSVLLSSDVKAIRSRYVAAFPVPQGDKGAAHEERCRQWSIRFAEQVSYEIPNQGYGVKRASSSRPISKDTLARWTPPGRLLIWDLLSGAGTGKPTLVTDPKSQDVTGQTFVAVVPTNHLGSADPNPEPIPTPEPIPLPVDPSFDVWLHQELPKLVAEFRRKRPELGEPGWEWISFQTIRRFVQGWSFDRVFAEV